MAADPQTPVGALPATFEERLANDSRWALSEGSLFFEEKGAVQESLRRIARHLNELGVPYAIAGGMALFQHGYRRFTEDVDILVTREGLKQIHQALEGRGYVRPFERSKNLRDAESRVKIEFLLAGDYPGDGKPKAVQFPDPAKVAIERDGMKFVSLSTLIELKLASGMTGSDRMKDLADVQELIKLLSLSAELSSDLNEAVRDKYLELWADVHRRAKRFVTLWRNEVPTPAAHTLDDLIEALGATESQDEELKTAVHRLQAMRADGVTFENPGKLAEGDSYLVTTDPEVAKKYGMEDEAEYLD